MTRDIFLLKFSSYVLLNSFFATVSTFIKSGHNRLPPFGFVVEPFCIFMKTGTIVNEFFFQSSFRVSAFTSETQRTKTGQKTFTRYVETNPILRTI